MRFAYADPPYIGQAKKHYAHDERCAEVNHRLLIAYLNDSFDGWALSLSTPSLKQILSLCPDDIRIGSWTKPFCAFKKNVNPAYAWEPVIFRGGRKRTSEQLTIRDWHAESITLRKGAFRSEAKGILLLDFGLPECSTRRRNRGCIPRHGHNDAVLQGIHGRNEADFAVHSVRGSGMISCRTFCASIVRRAETVYSQKSRSPRLAAWGSKFDSRFVHWLAASGLLVSPEETERMPDERIPRR